jgi:hypothetical protein
MDSNPHSNKDRANRIDNPIINVSDNKSKKFLIVKVPANVRNGKKAIEMLGGREKILSKFHKDEDLDLTGLFSKKISLEKCLSNDFIIRRKRLRNKSTGEKKFQFEVQGCVDSLYDYFALHDFICNKPNSQAQVTELKNLESKIFKIFINF